jgi:hypothetical protein
MKAYFDEKKGQRDRVDQHFSQINKQSVIALHSTIRHGFLKTADTKTVNSITKRPCQEICVQWIRVAAVTTLLRCIDASSMRLKHH